MKYHKPRIRRMEKKETIKGSDVWYLMAKLREIDVIKEMARPHPLLGFFKKVGTAEGKT